MSGRHYLLDTNAVIQYLAGNEELAALVAEAEFLAISVISKLEFLSFPNLSAEDRAILEEFLRRVTVFDVLSGDVEQMSLTTIMRSQFGLKMPDAIIAATAAVAGCQVVTADEHFKKQTLVPVVTFRPI